LIGDGERCRGCWEFVGRVLGSGNFWRCAWEVLLLPHGPLCSCPRRLAATVKLTRKDTETGGTQLLQCNQWIYYGGSCRASNELQCQDLSPDVLHTAAICEAQVIPNCLRHWRPCDVAPRLRAWCRVRQRTILVSTSRPGNCKAQALQRKRHSNRAWRGADGLDRPVLWPLEPCVSALSSTRIPNGELIP